MNTFKLSISNCVMSTLSDRKCPYLQLLTTSIGTLPMHTYKSDFNDRLVKVCMTMSYFCKDTIVTNGQVWLGLVKAMGSLG